MFLIICSKVRLLEAGGRVVDQVLLILDEYLTIWYFDHEGIIKSEPISFIADFPRVLVLLLAFQRFTLTDWGVIPQLNPEAVYQHQLLTSTSSSSSPPSTVNFNLSTGFINKLTSPDLSNFVLGLAHQDYLSNLPRCLAGRATAVLSCESGGQMLACKLSYPEVRRVNEGETLSRAREIAFKYGNDFEMTKYLPNVFFYGDIVGTGTRRIRSMLDLSWEGDRVLRVVIMNGLQKITSRKGRDFFHAWLDAVVCKSFIFSSYFFSTYWLHRPRFPLETWHRTWRS